MLKRLGIGIGLVWVGALLALLAATANCGTVRPTPPPLPEQGPVDVFDCSAPDIQDVEAAAEMPVKDCLEGFELDACLGKLAGDGIRPDAIACDVRDWSMRDSAKAAAGTATDAELRAAENAHNWLRARRVSFR